MKKIFAISILLLTSTASFATTYQCTAYAGGSKVGDSFKVEASKAAVAETKAKSRLKKSGKKVDYVQCD